MHDDRPDEPIPPLDRPGVAPVWRVLAIVCLLVATLLLSMVAVLFMALVKQGRNQPNNAFAMAAPPMAFAGGGGAVADPAEDVLDPLNPAYPTRQDLRPAGTFPLPGDPEADPDDPPQSPRQEFRGLAERPPVWVSPGPDLPERVLVSSDGLNMAYAGADGLIVGPLGRPIPVGQDVAAGMAAPGGRRWPAGVMVAPGQPARPHAPSGTQATLSGWSADGVVVAWVAENGQPRQHNTAAKITTLHEFKADALLPLADGRLVVIVREPRPKLDGVAGDLTTVKVMPAPGANPAATVLVGPEPSCWESPTLSPDGKRLAIVSDHGEKPGRRRVFVLSLDGNAPKVEPVSPAADRIDGVCWTPEGKGLVYARSQSPIPADHAPGMGKNACDLFLLDLATRTVTRLSRGGGFISPSVTKDGDLYFLMKVWPANRVPEVHLLKMTLEEARKGAADQEEARRNKGKQWKELAELAFQKAGVSAGREHGDTLESGAQKKLADAFAFAYKKKFDADPPSTAETLEWQRRTVAGFDLTPDERDRFRLLLGAVEGEYLRGRQKGSDWHTTKERGGAGAPVKAENAFGYAFNPLRPLRASENVGSPQSLTEVLFRAEGRPIVLSNDAVSAKAALDELADPDRVRGSALLAQGKGDEADRVLLAMTKRHADNHYLVIEVGTLLHRHGRAKALAELVKPLLGQLVVCGLVRDPRLYNLLGVAVLDGDTDKAIVAFQDALRCDLDYGPAYLNLAQAYQKAKRIGDARLCLRRYLKLHPEGEWADDARRRLAAAGDE